MVKLHGPIIAAFLLSSPALQSARVYFTDQPPGSPGTVVSVAPDGTDQRTLLSTPGESDLRGIAHHRASGKIYFLDNGPTKKIFSVRPDGSDQQEVVSISPDLLNSDLEVHDSEGKVYWAECNPGSAGNGFIKRTSLSGGAIETVVITAPGTATSPYFMFVDPAGGYIYWGVLSGGNGPSRFWRSTFEGQIDTGFLIGTSTRTRDIAIDPAGGTAYWCDRQTGNLFKRGFNSGINEVLIGGMNAPHGIALDIEAEKVYWADTGARGSGPSNTSARRIARCNFDGTGYENVSLPGPNSEPWDLTLDTSSPTYPDWRTRFFSAQQANSEPLDDPDEDGAANLLEYALGTHPLRAGQAPRLVPHASGVRHTRRTGSNLSYRVEVSTDLEQWHYNGDGSGVVWTVQSSVTPLGPELELVEVTNGPGLPQASHAFYRVHVTMP